MSLNFYFTMGVYIMRSRVKNCLITCGVAAAVIVTAAAVYFSKEVNSKNASVSMVSLEPISKNVNGIKVSIDPRMELLAAVQFISTYDQRYDLMTNQDFSYKNDMKNYFSSFANHKVVKTFEKLSGGGFSFDAPPTAMLYLSNPLSLKNELEFTDELVSRAEGGSLKEFALDLQKFAVDTKFDEFYNKHKDFYKAVVEKNSEIIGNTNYIDNLEKYYGMKQKSYNIILSPMFHSGGFGPRIKNKDGSYDIYSIQGTTSVEKDMPVFGDKSSFRYLVWHEFSHSFVNPLTTKNIGEINNYKNLYTPLYEKMLKQAYGDWESCVNEHIVRAVVARLTYLHEGKESYDNVINYEKSNGFIYIEALTKKLEEFESNKDKYRSFEEFYPELINVFKELSEKS